MISSTAPCRPASPATALCLPGRGASISADAAYSKMDRPIDPDCDCYTCRTFSAAYLSHLFRSEELLALRLATIHNLRFISNLMRI